MALANFAFAGQAFNLDAYRNETHLSGFTFQQPVTISLTYSDADVAGLDEASLDLDYWNGDAWAAAACGPYDRHPDENRLATPICHLSQFALFGVAAPQQRIYLPLVLH